MQKQPTPQQPYLGSPDNPRTAGVVCYITFLGWLIAYFALYRSTRDEVSGYHIRQTLLLHILSFVLNILGVLAFWGMFPYWLLITFSAALLLLWLIGVSGAVSGVKRSAPGVGPLAQRLFSSL